MRIRTFWPAVALAYATAGLFGMAVDGMQTSGERLFNEENAAAMSRMMDDMSAKPTGNVDADFAALMIPHHQGAIDMAVAELRHGHNEKLRRIAQEIIVDQQQEIAAMRLALGQPLPPSAPAATIQTRDGTTKQDSK